MPRPYGAVYALVRRVPRGRVTTYGRIAALLDGFTARMVGYAMAAAPDGVPWHRVINSEGRISLRSHDGGSDLQRALLEKEGIRFDQTGRVDLSRVGWPPPEAPKRKQVKQRTKRNQTRS